MLDRIIDKRNGSVGGNKGNKDNRQHKRLLRLGNEINFNNRTRTVKSVRTEWSKH